MAKQKPKPLLNDGKAKPLLEDGKSNSKSLPMDGKAELDELTTYINIRI